MQRQKQRYKQWENLTDSTPAQATCRGLCARHSTDFEASLGGGPDKVVVNGNKEFKSIEISPAAVDPDDVEMLQDLILSAVNEAVRLANETMEKEMSKVTGGLGNLGGFGF